MKRRSWGAVQPADDGGPSKDGGTGALSWCWGGAAWSSVDAIATVSSDGADAVTSGSGASSAGTSGLGAGDAGGGAWLGHAWVDASGAAPRA